MQQLVEEEGDMSEKYFFTMQLELLDETFFVNLDGNPIDIWVEIEPIIMPQIREKSSDDILFEILCLNMLRVILLLTLSISLISKVWMHKSDFKWLWRLINLIQVTFFCTLLSFDYQTNIEILRDELMPYISPLRWNYFF